MPNETVEMSGLDRFMARLESAVNDMVELKVITAVGNISVDVTSTTKDGITTTTRTETHKDSRAIITNIDLIDGDIMTSIDNVFVTDGAYASLRNDHVARVNDAQGIVSRNIAVLKELATAASQNWVKQS
jgi:hypothetical protein